MEKIIIKVKDLVKSYKNDEVEELILKSLNFDIVEGKITTILGPSGSGKTTLLNILSGLDRPTSGEVFVDNKNIISLNDEQITKFRLDKLGFIFQHYNLIQELSVKENVLLALELKGVKANDIDQILKVVGLDHAKDKKPNELSGGMQQRVAIARAVASRPEILICDEPTGALDESTGKEILALLQNINKMYGTTIILVTHNPGIKQMSDYIISILSGNIDSYVKNNNVCSAKDIK